NSPSTCFVPDGPQSDPRQISSPRFFASGMFVVDPYSHKLENGDQTTAPASALGQRAQSASASALQWMPMNGWHRRPALAAAANSRAAIGPGCPSEQW